MRISEQKPTEIHFFAPRKPKKPQYLRSCLPLVAKTHAIYSVFWQVPSKNAGMYAVFSMLQEVVFSMSKRQQHCKSKCFWLLARGKKKQEKLPKCPKWSFQTFLGFLGGGPYLMENAQLFQPPKRENTKVRGVGRGLTQQAGVSGQTYGERIAGFIKLSRLIWQCLTVLRS